MCNLMDLQETPFHRYVRNWPCASWVTWNLTFFLSRRKDPQWPRFQLRICFRKTYEGATWPYIFHPFSFLQEGLPPTTLWTENPQVLHLNTCFNHISTHLACFKHDKPVPVTLGRIHRMCRHRMWSHSALWFLHVKRPFNGNKLLCFSTWPGEVCRVFSSFLIRWPDDGCEFSLCLVLVLSYFTYRKGGDFNNSVF